MGYLERNAKFFKEIRDKAASGELTLARRSPVMSNEGKSTRTTSIGNFQSSTTGNVEWIALKEYSEDHLRLCISDLSRIRSIADGIPELTAEVPRFFGLLRSSAGEEIGIITEDFSKGGQDEVRSIDESEGKSKGVLLIELKDLFLGADNEDLANAMFLVGKPERRRLGDFNQLAVRMNLRQRTERFPIQEIKERIDEFTVFAAGESL